MFNLLLCFFMCSMCSDIGVVRFLFCSVVDSCLFSCMVLVVWFSVVCSCGVVMLCVFVSVVIIGMLVSSSMVR